MRSTPKPTPAPPVAVTPATMPLRQNWVLQPSLDFLLIIVAPILALTAALFVFRLSGAEAATSGIILFHIIATVAHHLPTFIRIYGDVDLFKRFKWSFILGPLIPFFSALGVLFYINYKGYPLETFFYLLIILMLWDPWHFFMQHFGFMRIYDRPNLAPRKLAARMDFSLCACWFIYTLIASSDWLSDILIGLYQHSRVPLMLSVSVDAVTMIQQIALIATLLMTLAYIGYVIWCIRKGYYVSWAKIALSIVTFSVMFIAYTPNALITKLAPGWSFRVGFAVIGVVHVTQYLAIVWRYNRNLAKRADRARDGFFRKLHARGGWMVAVLYVAVCFGYGAVLTTVHQNRWIMAVMLAIGFTSTLMHYYYDGFIWKLRHAQNRENLSLEESAGSTASVTTLGSRLSSWWSGLGSAPARVIFFRQCMYFGLPVVVLTLITHTVWRQPNEDYHVHMLRANEANRAGLVEETKREVYEAFEAMNVELPIAKKMAELKPTSANHAALAFLVYWHARYEGVIMPELEGQVPTAQMKMTLAENIERAAEQLERAVALAGSLGHPGREGLTADEAQRALSDWRSQAQRLRTFSEIMQQASVAR
ncbi:MAG: hypothetical protein QM760_03080 [Nibricoccus sp.]